jgi:hypothetical protein
MAHALLGLGNVRATILAVLVWVVAERQANPSSERPSAIESRSRCRIFRLAW